MSDIMKFDVELYVNQFKNKKFLIKHLIDIEKIIVSFEYSKFINSVYNFFNSKVECSEERLNAKYYNDAGEIIDRFWKLLLSNDSIANYQSNMKIKLKI
jgi:hypothetical protein